MPGRGGDTSTGAWSLWYFHRALWRADTDLYYTRLLYAPRGAPLHFHVQSIGAGLLAEPLHLLGLSLPAVFDLSWLLTFFPSGVGAAFLGFVATGSRPGALVAGALFMLCPFRTAHGLGQIELLGTQWMPFGVGLLLLAFPHARTACASVAWRCVYSALAGAALAMTILCSFYLGAFVGMLAAAYLCWRVASSRESRRIARRTERIWTALAASFAVLSLGETLHVAGRDLGIPLPFLLLEHVPVLRGNRAPSRFVIMVGLCLVPLVAAGVRRIVAWAGPRRFRADVGVRLARRPRALPRPVEAHPGRHRRAPDGRSDPTGTAHPRSALRRDRGARDGEMEADAALEPPRGPSARRRRRPSRRRGRVHDLPRRDGAPVSGPGGPCPPSRRRAIMPGRPGRG